MEKALRRLLPEGKFPGVSPTRSKTMSAIKGRNNKSTEQRLRYSLVANKISGWTIKNNALPGRPDFLFASEKVAVFVDGCFWHGCPQCGHFPKTNKDFWKEKITRNKARDKRNAMELHKAGYTVLRLWEHELRDNLPDCIERIRKMLLSPRQ